MGRYYVQSSLAQLPTYGEIAKIRPSFTVPLIFRGTARERSLNDISMLSPDIFQFALLHHDSLEFPHSHVRSLQLFKDTVVHPSLRALSIAIEANNRDEDPTALFLADDLGNLFQATVESYLLAVQSMWERGLRDLLITREKQLKTGIKIPEIQKANWSGKRESLQMCFERLLGLPLTAFDSYADLDFLQHLGNAIRHGDGSSAERIHILAPSLWFKWVGASEMIHADPYTIVAAKYAPKHPPFNEVTLEERLLEQMIQSVTSFWQDLEYIRCNSFRRQADSTIRQMENWAIERCTRQTNRFWNPN